jgi:hypothetical protein
MKKIIPFFACLLIILTTADTLDAQRRRSRRPTTETEEKTSFADKINYEIRLGNLGFGGGFAIDFKPSVGYKVNKFLTVGGFYRFDYDFINNIGFQNEDFSLLSHGPGLLARGKILRGYYIQGEYTFFNFDNFDTNFKADFPSIGVGMVQGGDNWKYNLEIMLIADNFARDYFGNTVEFWFSFSKNF